MTVTIKAVVMAAALVISSPVLAGQSLPKPFAAHNAQETVAISYADWSYILNASVFDAGPSDRAFAPPPRHRPTFRHRQHIQPAL
ncbi:hypothetical protein [Kordiimonas marina]|uniref:hypothetical protein n=1 Tax=Kordiimonas marina TaxID=2872312 RepID=UPI001FF4B770|nr:hypothetical protein [Kordiimonas marina]MCJ9430633.1 hypothetical protein [Kordiimonas marina]